MTRVDAHEIAHDDWRSARPLPFPLSSGTFVQSEGSPEGLGGWNGTRMHTQCLTLDAALSQGAPSGTSPEARVYGRAEILDGMLYLLGGSSDAGDLARAI